MTKTMKRWSVVAPAILLCSWATADADVITDWNEITLTCVQGPTNPQRAGPPGLLDIAIVQAAVHDAVQAIEGRFESYHYENPALRGVGSLEAAAASAAHGVLKGMYGASASCLANVSDPAIVYAGDPGLKAGTEAAAALLQLRRPTFQLPTDPWTGSHHPGQWRPTPGTTHAQFTFMAVTAPFAMKSPKQFRPAPPPRLGSTQYWLDYIEVKALGANVSKWRTAAQTEASRFWTANFFSQWNEAVRYVANQRVAKIGDKARLFALVAFAAADSQISVYDAKYHYNYWRPITAIQEGGFDGNHLTKGDPGWTPFIATPPYPDYSSGANCLAASITGVLRHFFGTDKVQLRIWTTASGVTRNPRVYRRLSDLEREMVGVRVWQGIHFRTAEEVGRQQGKAIADWTYRNYLRPLRRK
ncbi:MAG TPA: vanadium-dependent haloperoxidase [Steroidobacteraceae bacterium]|mgnify:CR=1 FL=1